MNYFILQADVYSTTEMLYADTNCAVPYIQVQHEGTFAYVNQSAGLPVRPLVVVYIVSVWSGVQNCILYLH